MLPVLGKYCAYTHFLVIFSVTEYTVLFQIIQLSKIKKCITNIKLCLNDEND